MFKSKLNLVQRCLHHTHSLFACWLAHGLVSQHRSNLYEAIFRRQQKRIVRLKPHDTSNGESEKNTSPIYWFTHCAAIIIRTVGVATTNKCKFILDWSAECEKVRQQKRIVKNWKNKAEIVEENFDLLCVEPSFRFSNLIPLNSVRLNCEIHLRIHFHFCNEALIQVFKEGNRHSHVLKRQQPANNKGRNGFSEYGCSRQQYHVGASWFWGVWKGSRWVKDEKRFLLGFFVCVTCVCGRTVEHPFLFELQHFPIYDEWTWYIHTKRTHGSLTAFEQT